MRCIDEETEDNAIIVMRNQFTLQTIYIIHLKQRVTQSIAQTLCNHFCCKAFNLFANSCTSAADVLLDAIDWSISSSITMTSSESFVSTTLLPVEIDDTTFQSLTKYSIRFQIAQQAPCVLLFVMSMTWHDFDQMRRLSVVANTISTHKSATVSTAVQESNPSMHCILEMK